MDKNNFVMIVFIFLKINREFIFIQMSHDI